MADKISGLDLDFVRRILDYDPETGVLRWRERPNPGSRVTIGSEAGGIGVHGARVIKIDGISYLAHRLAWFHFYGEVPPPLLDHRDCDRANNPIANLRAATPQQNSVNARLSVRNKSGLKGASRAFGKWRAQIIVKGKHISLGLHDTAKQAHDAYMEAARKHHGEYARTK